jgi:hypothetical protein
MPGLSAKSWASTSVWLELPTVIKSSRVHFFAQVMAAKLDIQKCFEILELNPGATAEEAKKAYKDLASVWHPDRVPPSNPRLQKKAVERLKEINAAYDMVLPYLQAEQIETQGPDSSPSPRPAPESKTWPAKESRAGLQPETRSVKSIRANIALVLLVISILTGFIYFYWAAYIERMYEPQVLEKKFEWKKAQGTAQSKDIIVKTQIGSSEQQVTFSARTQIKIDAGDSAALDTLLEKEVSALKQKEINTIDNIIASAKNYLKSQQYLKSKDSYETAFKVVGDSQFKNDKHFLARRQEIAEALLSKEIVYGTKGFIKYKNKWVAPDEYQKHYVMYKGRKRYFKELKNVITQIMDPQVRLYLINKYGDQTIHKKKVDCYKLALKKNDKSSAHFRAFYRWEVWTFKTIDEGDLSVDMVYHSGKDQWQIGVIQEHGRV